MATRPSVIRQRALYVLAGLALGTGLLAGRLVYLQIFQASKLSALAQAQRTKAVDLSAERGEIVDRNGKALAASVEAFSIYAMPREAKKWDRKDTAAKLAPVLKMQEPVLFERLRGKSFRWLTRLTDEKVRKEVRALKLPGIGIVRESKRVYPKGRLAATLIGFVGVDNQGLAGIEHAFDKVLRGPEQKVNVEVDAYGREIMREGTNSAMDAYLQRGSQVVLTIDENLQHVAERELGTAIVDSGAKRGAVMIMDPRTGDLLAFATLPTYDPNHFSDFEWNDIKNWPVTDVYEPGSTMKVFTIAGALDKGRIGLNTTFHCPPFIKVDGRLITDHEAPRWNRQLKPIDIMEVSSNVGTTQIAFRMKPAEHRAFLSSLGFGADTGSGITGESKGVVPKLPWRRISHATLSYGQGVSVTALQLLAAAQPVGNDGIRVTPRLIDKVISNKGEILEVFPPKTVGRVLKSQTAKSVMSMLEQVVQKGTGIEAHVPGYRVAGKTGTAQKIRDDGRGYSNDVIASFLGFAPAEKPRFVILTLLDAPRKVHWASLTAAPLFRKVAAEALRQAGVQPTEPLTPIKKVGVPTHEL